jgi:hypothetical protein
VPDPGFVNLDLDDITSYGPETITIEQVIPGTYRYLVHDYTNKGSTSSSALSNSGANVKVYDQTGLIGTYNVPPNQGGTVWAVFELDGSTGVITNLNDMYYESNPSYVNTLSGFQLEWFFPDTELFKNLPEKR